MLEINHLYVRFGPLTVVEDLSLSIQPGETLGLVGESGSGKSLTALSVLGLQPAAATVEGQILLDGTDLLTLPAPALRQIRGRRVAVILQDPLSSLNPVLRCGEQVAEAIRQHQGGTSAALKKRVLQLFEQVQLPDPERIWRSYPHELSGGQCQRVMIAQAMSTQPDLLIADEPTTALDPTVQREILDLLQQIQRDAGWAVLLISHDLGVVGAVADRVAVMRAGRVVESGTTADVLRNPQHPYTRGLLFSRPPLDRTLHRIPTLADFEADNTAAPSQILTPAGQTTRRQSIQQALPLLDDAHFTVEYPVQKNWLGQPRAWLRAVDDVTISLFEGECLGVVGESGSGKSSLARAVATRLGRDAVLVFQNPYASLNPLLTVESTLGEVLRVRNFARNAAETRTQTLELLTAVGLDASYLDRLPAALSGGQRQRVCIARALAARPKVLICDEITSALDVSVQATVLNLLLDLRDRMGLTLLLVSHDLRVVRQLCDRVVVLHQGRAVDFDTPEALLARTDTSIYTRQLLSAVL